MELNPRIFTGWESKSVMIQVHEDGHFGPSAASMYAAAERGLTDSDEPWHRRFGYRDLDERGKTIEAKVVRVCPGFKAPLETLIQHMRESTFRLAGLEHAVRFAVLNSGRVKSLGKLYALGGNLPIARSSGKLLVPYVSLVQRRTATSGSTGLRVGTLRVDVMAREFDHTMDVLVIRK